MGFSAFIERGKGKRVFLWLGFGLFLVTFGGGPLGLVSGSIEHAASWDSTLFAQIAFFVGTSLGCLGMKSIVRQGFLRQGHVLGASAYVAATLFCLAAQPVLTAIDVQTGAIVRITLSLLVGMAYAPPLLFWVDRFLGLSQTCGRFGFFAVLVPCYLLDPFVMTLASYVVGVSYAYSLAMVACAAVSSLIQITLFRPFDTPAHRSEEGAEKYRLTVHSVSVLVCLGFSWGIAEAASLYVLGGGWSGESAVSMVVAFGLIFVVAVAMRAFRAQSGVRFGAFVRFSIVACGAVVVAVPLVFESVPSVLFPLCNVAMIVGEVSLIVFSIDICREEGKLLTSVFAVNYAAFMAAGCVSSAFFWLTHMVIGGHTAWLLTAIVPTWVILAAVPFLPSRSSDAVVFTLGTLPENEGYEANIFLQRERMAQRYGLTAGEAEVLDRLLQGMNREQIAADMYLSPWTIKSRISAIYRKCGIHSYKELVKLVSNDDA